MHSVNKSTEEVRESVDEPKRIVEGSSERDLFLESRRTYDERSPVSGKKKEWVT